MFEKIGRVNGAFVVPEPSLSYSKPVEPETSATFESANATANCTFPEKP
jgi:hypothetical protein